MVARATEWFTEIQKLTAQYVSFVRVGGWWFVDVPLLRLGSGWFFYYLFFNARLSCARMLSLVCYRPESVAVVVMLWVIWHQALTVDCFSTVNGIRLDRHRSYFVLLPPPPPLPLNHLVVSFITVSVTCVTGTPADWTKPSPSLSDYHRRTHRISNRKIREKR